MEVQVPPLDSVDTWRAGLLITSGEGLEFSPISSA